MPGYYESEWDKAKTAFEKDSGKIIAVVEKEALAGAKKKVSGLRDEKTDVPRLKKPAASGWFGRKSSGMESACKALDKASGAKVSAKDKRKAFDDYAKVAKKYEKELDDSVKDKSKPYRHVIPQIKVLGKKMWEILEGFRAAHLSDEDALFGHLDQRNDSEILGDANDLLTAIEKLDAEPDATRRKRGGKIAVLQEELDSLLAEISRQSSKEVTHAVGRASKQLEKAVAREAEEMRSGLGAGSSRLSTTSSTRNKGGDMVTQMNRVEEKDSLASVISAALGKKANAVYAKSRQLEDQGHDERSLEILRGLTGELQNLVNSARGKLPRGDKHQKTFQAWEESLENRFIWREEDASERISTVRRTANEIVRVYRKAF